MKIAVWYHCVLSGLRIPREDHAISILSEQMRAIKLSGLFDIADQRCFCVNGGDGDFLTLCSLAPVPGNIVAHHEGQSEIPTLNLLRENLKPGWFVMYHQIKGVTHPGEKLYEVWRGCMERACVWNWRRCVADLERGFDAVGCHWLTPQQYPAHVTSPFFGGTFWWAKSDYLLQLPALPADTHENRYEAESWIGRRRPYPRVMDYHHAWPGLSCDHT